MPADSPGQTEPRTDFRFYRLSFWLLIAIGISASIGAGIAMMHAGIGWDAHIDTNESLVIRELVPSLPPGSDISVAYEQIYFTSEFYGILLPQLGDFLHFVFTGSSDLLQVNDLDTYRWQGLASIFLAVGAAASLACAIASALKSSMAGAFTWALIMTTPLYFGMSYINIKDMPVAVGLTLLTSAFILNRSAKSKIVRWGVANFLMAAGAFIAAATRPGLWPLIVLFSGLTLVIFATLDIRRRELKRSLPSMVGLGIAGAVTLFLLWLTNPLARINLVQWLIDSFLVMRSYPWEGTIRVAGQDLMSTELPLWYVPAWIFAQMPIATLILLAASAVVIGCTVFCSGGASLRPNVFLLTPVFLQAAVLPVAVVATGATLYDGLRHLLFLVPPLLGIGSLAIVAIEKSKPRLRISPRNLAGIVSILIVFLSGWATLRWVPYSYAYINPIAGWSNPERDWELDFWGVSAIEGVEKLNQTGLDSVVVLPSEGTSSMIGGQSLESFRESSGTEPYGLYVFKRWDSSIGDCELLFSIVRDGQVLGEGAKCPPLLE